MIRLYRMLENVWFGWPQKLRFLLVGGFNTVSSYGLFVLMVAAIGIPYKIAIAIGYVISTNVSIFTMRYYVFRSKGSLKKEYAKAWGVYLTTMLINYAAMYAMVDLGAVNELLAQGIYTVLITVFTYLMHKYFSFAK